MLVCVNLNCVKCKAPHYLIVDEGKWKQFTNGESYIQDLFPELSATDRE